VELKFIGSRVAVMYTVKKGSGNMNVTIRDAGGNVVSSASIVENGKKTLTQEIWNSGALGVNGQYTLTLTHQSGGVVNLDAVTVYDGTTTISTETDNTVVASLDYKGYWKQMGRTGATNNTLVVSQMVGDSVKFTISGRQVGILFARDWTSGSMQVRITDAGESTDVITPVVINQKSLTKTSALQQQWLSGDLGSVGTYIVTLTHLSGGNVNLDGITVGQTEQLKVSAVSQVGDDAKTNIDYKGFWSFASGLIGPDGGTLARSIVKGSTAEIQFTGTSASLYYATEPKGGIISVSIDGGPAVMINQLSKKPVYGAYWTSPTLVEGEHTMTITHYWGGQVNIDMVRIK